MNMIFNNAPAISSPKHSVDESGCFSQIERKIFIELIHKLIDVRFWGVDDEMVMIAHENKRMKIDRMAFVCADDAINGNVPYLFEL